MTFSWALRYFYNWRKKKHEQDAKKAKLHEERSKLSRDA